MAVLPSNELSRERKRVYRAFLSSIGPKRLVRDSRELVQEALGSGGTMTDCSVCQAGLAANNASQR